MTYDFEVGDELKGATVQRRFTPAHGNEVLVMEMGENTDKEHLQKEMAQLGWDYKYDSTTGDFLYFQKQ